MDQESNEGGTKIRKEIKEGRRKWGGREEGSNRGRKE